MLLTFLYLAAVACNSMATPGMEYRLPTTVLPQHYWVRLRPTFEAENFLTTGDVRILLRCVNTTKEIQFNTNTIDIDTSTLSLQSEAGDVVEVLHSEWTEGTQKYRLELSSELEEGRRYYLAINFSYPLNQNLEGFYRSSYKDSQGNTRWLATTQFSPINARRAFPCWDEPSFKAVFNITLGRHTNMTSISNMPRYLTTPMTEREDWVWDHFQTTLPMSTYLLAFIVTDLPSSDVVNTSHPHFKVWSRPELQEDMDDVAKLSPRVLTFISHYFDIPFPLEKIDLFAVPDFGFSAMENWGLITFAETAVKNSQTIAHELAHQWFGNLVTPHWWEDLWLKEGFATFIGITALAGIDNKTEPIDKWIVSELQPSLFDDSLLSSHPVSNPVADPSNIWEAFDVISYQKGSSIIRMMCEFLGEDKFREGLNRYLRTYTFSNARRQQLWEAYRNISEIDVGQVMDGWTLQTGYPVLNISRQEANGLLHLSQERFLLNGEKDEDSLWYIPYTLLFENANTSTPEVYWLNTSESTHDISGAADTLWYLANLNQSGYYRVNYDLKNWNLLIDKFWELPRLSEMQLINDAFNLAIPGRLPYSVPLRIAEKIHDSMDKLLWNVTINELMNIAYLATGTELLPQFKNYALTLFDSTNLTYRSDDLVMVKFAANLGQNNLINESINILQQMMEGKNISYPKELLGSIYCNGVRNSGQEMWDFMWSRYLLEKKPEEKKRLMQALACSTDQNNLYRLLNGILNDDSGIKKQEAKLVFSAVASNQLASDLALNFLIENWDNLKLRFGISFKFMPSMVLSLGPVLNKVNQYEKLEKLYKDKLDDLGSTTNAFKNSLERIKINIEWINEHYNTILNYVKYK